MMSTQQARLRAFAIKAAKGHCLWMEHDAIGALAEDADPTAWRPWAETQAEHDQWFLWRDPLDPGDMHADQVGINEEGFIEMKHGCGLSYYPECQPCRFAPDVLAIIAKSRAS